MGMNRKNSKKYLISILIILFAGYAAALGIFYLVSKDVQTSALFALIAAIVPCASLTGSVYFGAKLISQGKLTKKIAAIICVLFPFTLIFVTVSGVFLIIPEIINSLKVIVSEDPQDEETEDNLGAKEENENEKNAADEN